MQLVHTFNVPSLWSGQVNESSSLEAGHAWSAGTITVASMSFEMEEEATELAHSQVTGDCPGDTFTVGDIVLGCLAPQKRGAPLTATRPFALNPDLHLPIYWKSSLRQMHLGSHVLAHNLLGPSPGLASASSLTLW